MSGPVDDAYATLELPVEASVEQIEVAYSRLSASLAPTSLAMYALLDEEEGGRLRAALEAAYRLLRDPQQRAADASRKSLAALSSYGACEAAVAIDEPLLAAAPRPPPLPAAAAAGVDRAAPPPPPPLPAAAVAGVDKAAPLRPLAGRSRRGLLSAAALAEVDAATEFSGALLRRLREQAPASLADVAEITKISKRYLMALEENDFAVLPALVYVRGFVTEYARALGLDPRLVAPSYMALYRRQQAPGR